MDKNLRIKKCYLSCFLIVVVFQCFSQEKSFNPSGRPFAVIYANFHQGLTDAASDESAFELVRGYLGYEYTFTPEFYAKVNLDIGSPEDLSEYAKSRRYAYFKNAYLRYTHDKLQVEFGLISLREYKLMEKIWQRRYLMKTFADEYSIGSSADLGMYVKYSFSKKWEADFTIMNGEGYNNIQSDGIFKYSIGSTIIPIKNFTSRFYFDFTKEEEVQATYHFFSSYNFNGRANIAGEALYRTNEDCDANCDRYGYSVYGNYNFKEKFQLFARFDKIASNKLSGESTPWNLSDDGSALIAGIQFSPIKQVKFALNYHDWVPYAANSDTKAFIYLNVEVKM